MPIEGAFLAAFDLLPDAIIATDECGRITFANRATAALLGWPADELRGKPLTTIMPPRMHLSHEAGFRRYMATHHPRIMGRAIRLPALRRDGTEVDVELTLASAGAQGGTEIVIGTLRALTDRVELERQLRVIGHMRATTAAASLLTSVLDVERVLWVAVEMLVTEFEAALARIWLCDADPGFLRLRASAGLSRRVQGSPRERIDIANHPFKIGLVARTHRPFTKNGLRGDDQFDQDWVTRETIEAAAALPLLVSGELEGVLVAFFRRAQDDEVFEVLAMLAAMVATAVNDASLYEQAQRAVRARQEVLNVVSHDLRGPLGVIDMGAMLLMRTNKDADVLLRMRRAAARMNVLIRDLLDASAIDSGRLRMEPAEQSVGDLLSEVLDLVRPIAEDKHIELTLEAGASPTKVLCDRARIVQVFANLLDNAIKYTAEGGAVAVRVAEGERTVQFTVADDGPGIAAEELPHVFDRYWQGHAGRRGVGLGLAIVKGIVEAHHGAIRAESTLGQGSRFVFDLPRAA